MFRVILIFGISALGLGTLALAQAAGDAPYLPVAGGDGPWYLQDSTCTLAHNDDESGATLWLRTGTGTDIEFADPHLQGVREGVDAALTVAVDGTAEDAPGQGKSYEDGRSGYRLNASDELIDRIDAGRLLEVRHGTETVLRLDLAGAGPAIAAMRACFEALAASSTTNAM